MPAVLGFQAYNKRELEVAGNEGDAFVYFLDRELAGEVTFDSAITLDHADQTILDIESVLHVTHADVDNLDDMLKDLGGEESETGFLLSKEDFSVILMFAGETTSAIEGEDELYHACKNRDALQDFYVGTDWENYLVYVNRYGDED